jgi:subtilisin-like proprotein convertase family protein
MIPHNLNAASPVVTPQSKGGGKEGILPNAPQVAFSNTGAITIPGTGTLGNASPYPSTIAVSGLNATVSKVTLTLDNLTHTNPDDIDILLVGPTGVKMILMSDSGGSNNVSNIDLTFDDTGAALTDGGTLTTGTFRPTNNTGADAFPAPAPAAPYATTLSAFNGTDPNGDWDLYVVDDSSNDTGDIDSGWILNIETQPIYSNAGLIVINETANTPDTDAATPYPSTVSVSGFTGTVSKVTVTLDNINHTFLDDIGILLVGPTGVKVLLMSDSGGNSDMVDVDLTFDEADPDSLPDNAVIAAGTYNPTQGASGSGGDGNPVPANFLAPAPAGPYATTLNAFNGLDPNGTWSLYIIDDTDGDSGNIENGWKLTISAPTAVELASFEATSYDSGTFIEWTTGYEADNLGFNVYREEAGRRARINSSIVAGSALLAGSRTVLRAGESYGWWEPSAPSKHMVQYWLEDVDLNGKRTLHGPITAKAVGGSPPSTGRAALLSQRGAGAASISPTTSITQSQSSARPAINNIGVQWDLASRAAVKISVRKEGWYRVTQPDLVAAGLDVLRDPRLLQLFADGQELPIIVKGGASGRLEPSDSIEFYATALDTPYTDARVYWLVSGSQAGRRISQVSDFGKPSQATGFLATVERKDRTIYFAALNNGEAENFFGPVVATESVSQVIPVRHLDVASEGEATLEVALQGVTDLVGDAPDHTVNVKLNGVDIGTISFDGRERKVGMFSFSSQLLNEGENSFTFAALGGETDVTLIDYLRLTYAHTFKAEDNRLRLTASAQQALRITGFDQGEIRVFDITDSNNVQEVGVVTEPEGTGFAVTFTPPGAGQRLLFAVSDNQASSPAQIKANRPSTWNRAAQVADAVVITHTDLTNAATPLVTFRRGQGYSVMVADVEDLYDEFSYGAHSPQAVRDFLARANSTWKRRPRFAMLVGDASFDPRNYLGLGNWDLVPTKLVGTTMLETACDDWLADFNGDDVPEIAVGRLPARTPAEAAAIVAKIIAYERGPRAEGVVMVADKNEDYDFESASRGVSATLPAGVAVKEIFRGPMGDVNARTELLAAIIRAPKIVNYLGHGSVGVWSGNLLTSQDAGLLGDSQGPSLFVAMTCLNGFFHDQYGDSLAEVLIKMERGGAVAVWASSSLTEPGTQALMNQELYRQLFNNATFGEAAMRAKAFVGSSDVRQSWILFGDPMTRLK